MNNNSHISCRACKCVLGDKEIKMSGELLPDYFCFKCALNASPKCPTTGLPKNECNCEESCKNGESSSPDGKSVGVIMVTDDAS